jgi:hypothetical protein
VVKRVLGMSVGGEMVRAVLVEGGTIAWAGQAPYSDDLAAVIGHLAGESGKAVRRARVVLERDVVQLRTLDPVPPLKPLALRRYVALEASRVFRKNGAPMVTDGIRVAGETGDVLWAAAAEEPLLSGILAGSAEAGLTVESIGPAADVLPASLAHRPLTGDIAFPNGVTIEVLAVDAEGTWRSRMVRGSAGEAPEDWWAPPLGRLGADAPYFAAAYGAAVALPRLELWPGESRAARAREVRRRVLRLATAGLSLWLLASAVYVGRLFATLHSSTQYLDAVSSRLDSALSARRDLDAGRGTLATMAAAERTRSHQLGLLAGVTAALGDSAYLVTYQVGTDGVVRLSGYAPSAARVLAALERAGALRRSQLEGPVTRETTAGNRVLDRFAVVGRGERSP